jgi:hypothetical protein
MHACKYPCTGRGNGHPTATVAEVPEEDEEEDEDDADDAASVAPSVNTGVARAPSESKDERKARKQVCNLYVYACACGDCVRFCFHDLHLSCSAFSLFPVTPVFFCSPTNDCVVCVLHQHHHQATKAAQRENRQRKKELRQAFKREELSMNNQLAQQRVHNPQGVRI